MTAGQAIKQHCSDCLGVEKGQRAFDCAGPSCPLYVCSPFRGKLLPVGQRPTDFDEVVETAKLAALAKQYPKRQPSGSLCTAMCRECMGVRIPKGMPDDQKGGGARESCGKPECALYPWQPYKPGGRVKSGRTGGAGFARKAATVQSDCPKPGVGAPGPPIEAAGQVALAI